MQQHQYIFLIYQTSSEIKDLCGSIRSTYFKYKYGPTTYQNVLPIEVTEAFDGNSIRPTRWPLDSMTLNLPHRKEIECFSLFRKQVLFKMRRNIFLTEVKINYELNTSQNESIEVFFGNILIEYAKTSYIPLIF